MSSGVEASLLNKIVKESFGESCSLIISLLIQRGAKELHELYELLLLDWQILRNSLFVLIKHNIVHALYTTQQSASTSKVYTVKYQVHVDGILARLRHAKFLLHVENKYGPGARLLVLQAFKTGCCKAKDAVAGACQDAKVVESLLHADNGTEKPAKYSQAEFTEKRLSSLFTTLVAQSVFARILDVDAHLANVKESNSVSAPAKTTVTPARGKAKQAYLEQQALERAAAIGGPTKRKVGTGKRPGKSLSSMESAAVDSGAVDLFADLTMQSGLRKSAVTTKGSPNKRAKKSIVAEDSDAINESSDSSPIGRRGKSGEEKKEVVIDMDGVFRVNTEFLTNEIHKQVIENFVALRWGNLPLVRMITRALVTGCRRVGDRVYAQALPLEQVCIAVAKAAKGTDHNWDSNTIFLAIDGLSRHSDKFVKAIKKDCGTAFQLDWDRIRHVLQRRVTNQ